VNWRINVVVVFGELAAKGVMFTKAVLLQLCVLCVLRGAVFHIFYILTAMDAAGSTQHHLRPPPAHITHNQRSAHVYKAGWNYLNFIINRR
jgi:hypothetical protein